MCFGTGFVIEQGNILFDCWQTEEISSIWSDFLLDIQDTEHSVNGPSKRVFFAVECDFVNKNMPMACNEIYRIP